MNNSVPRTAHQRTREVLLRNWDPKDVAKRLDVYGPSAVYRYDTDIEPLFEILRSGASDDALMTFLIDRQAESMCFPGLERERLRRVARVLRQAAQLPYLRRPA